MSKWSEKIPSFLWIPLIIGAIALFFGAVLAFFFGIGYVEGFGSLLLLVLGWIGFRIGNNSDDLKLGSFGIALGITFFALMGAALDQTGNFIYNKPLEWIYCSPESELFRETVQRSGSRGGISLTQNFACIGKNGEVLRNIGMFEMLLVRFSEYLVIGYILLGLSRLFAILKNKIKIKDSDLIN